MRRSLILIVTCALCACNRGPAADSPEGVARRYVEAVLTGDRDAAVALTTAADRAAATDEANADEQVLTKDGESRRVQGVIGKHARITGQTATVTGEKASATVQFSAPDVTLNTLFSSYKGDPEQSMKEFDRQVSKATMTDRSEQLALRRENGAWLVDTDWNDKADRRQKEQLKSEYEKAVEQDYRRAAELSQQLVKTYPNDTGWKQERDALSTLTAVLGKVSVAVTSAGLYQGEYRIEGTLRNASQQTLQTVTVRVTFLNGSQAVGTPEYATLRSDSIFYRTPVLGPGESKPAELTGDPPAEWTGQRVRLDVTAFTYPE
ncbi:hypothetical protein GCM10008956_30370 [Deinococcus arenae]|uniref:Lipoprotein n=1 Tax=Deinococcus arenae TaxID=1452751 RepID=A0A8H9L9X8_9DEIO|nr:hypothetical protein [Deinococcus arenae]GGM52205.1 hypothetical protein GCM10008956_30370 [Deinococcus arenae]